MEYENYDKCVNSYRGHTNLMYKNIFEIQTKKIAYIIHIVLILKGPH
jgi:hypothetical protein